MADPAAVLDQLAADLRRRVDTLVAPIKAIELQGAPTGGRLGIQSFTACVRADGTVDHGPVT